MIAHVASATSTTFPAFEIWPTIGDRSYIAIPSSQGLYQWQYSFDLSNQFVFRSLDLLDPKGTRVRSVVDRFFGHFFSGAVGLTDFVQFGFTLPVFSTSKFEAPTAAAGTASSNVSEIGDVRIATKVRVIDANRTRWGLAFEPFVTIPLGADDHYLGYSSVAGGIRAIGDVLITERIRIALNLGAEFVGDDVLINNIDFSHRWLSGLGVSFAPTSKITVSAEAVASSAFRNFFSDKDTTPVEFLAGVQWDVGQTGFKIGVGGGSCGICGGRGAKGRGFLNLSYRRMTESYALKEQREAEVRYVTLGGQSLQEKLAFAIYELTEKCPIESVRYVVGRDDPRCTEIYELQGLADKCPPKELFNRRKDDPKCWTIYALRERDSDQDGLPDFADWCPTERGKKEEHGCPSRAFLIIDPEKGQILTQTIPFEFRKATLREDAKAILNKVAGAIHAQPAINLISIEGHTDHIGSEGANQNLSWERARAVYRYLVDQGINPARFTTRGFGERYPLGDNSTEEGRAKNRRVEFIIEKVKRF